MAGRKTTIGYRFFNRSDSGQLISKVGEQSWEVGRWEKYDGELILCQSGFHASPTIYDALEERQGNVFGMVECRRLGAGRTDSKFVCAAMRPVAIYDTKQVAGLAAVAAIMVIGHYVKWHKNDDQPIKAMLVVLDALAKDGDAGGKINRMGGVVGAARNAKNAAASLAAYAVVHAANAARDAINNASIAAAATSYSAIMAVAGAANAVYRAAESADKDASHTMGLASRIVHIVNFNKLAGEYLALETGESRKWLRRLLRCKIAKAKKLG